MTFAGQDRYDWIKQEVEKYWKRRRRAAGLYILTALESFFLIPIIVILPFDVRPSYAAAVLAILMATLLGANWLNQRAEKLLPPVEDRVLYRLKPALTSLKAYAGRNWNDSDRKSALKNLKRVANLLDRWNLGNLKFVKDEIGDALNEFKKNFRGRVVLAVERADKSSVPDLLSWLSNFQSALDTEALNKASLETWNQYLSQPSAVNTAAPRFPYQEPRQNILRRLISQWFQLTIGFLVFVAALATGLIAFYVVHTSVDAAYVSGATVFAGMLVLLVYVFRPKEN